MPALAGRETATIKFMAADQIKGQRDDIRREQRIDDDGSGARIKTDNQRQSGDQFQKGNNNGNQIDRNRWKKVISVYNFGKLGRRCNFMETGIDKSQTENPTCRQFDPAVIYDGLQAIIQSDSPLLSSPKNRR